MWKLFNRLFGWQYISIETYGGRNFIVRMKPVAGQVWHGYVLRDPIWIERGRLTRGEYIKNAWSVTSIITAEARARKKDEYQNGHAATASILDGNIIQFPSKEDR